MDSPPMRGIVDFDINFGISGSFSLEHRLLKAISIALLTGTFVLRPFTFKKTMLSSGPIFKDSSFLSASSVYVSTSAPGNSSKSGAMNSFKL